MQRYNNYSENLAGIGEVSGYMLLKLNLNQVKMMSKCDLSVDDVRYIPMYEEYGKPTAAFCPRHKGQKVKSI